MKKKRTGAKVIALLLVVGVLAWALSTWVTIQGTWQMTDFVPETGSKGLIGDVAFALMDSRLTLQFIQYSSTTSAPLMGESHETGFYFMLGQNLWMSKGDTTQRFRAQVVGNVMNLYMKDVGTFQFRRLS